MGGGRVFFVLGRARGERKAKGVREGRGTFSLESFQGRWGGGLEWEKGRGTKEGQSRSLLFSGTGGDKREGKKKKNKEKKRAREREKKTAAAAAEERA